MCTSYTGKDTSLDDSNGATHGVVLKLIEGIEHRGHHVYMDNYYTSPTLFTSLQQLGFGACGTVRVNRRGMPKEVTAAKLKKGEMTTSEVKKGMLALKWQDKRAVVMLSTIHDDSRVTKRRRTRLVAGGIEEVQKPTMVEKYNMYMGGVDKGDQLMSYYGFSHRTVKWWRRAFFHLFENAIVNAYILYRLSVQDGRKMDHKQFRIELAKQLLANADHQIGPPSRHLNALPPPARLTERHFPEKGQTCASGRPSQPVCVVCSNKREARRQRINASSVSYLCVQYLALNYTILK